MTLEDKLAKPVKLQLGDGTTVTFYSRQGVKKYFLSDFYDQIVQYDAEVFNCGEHYIVRQPAKAIGHRSIYKVFVFNEIGMPEELK